MSARAHVLWGCLMLFSSLLLPARTNPVDSLLHIWTETSNPDSQRLNAGLAAQARWIAEGKYPQADSLGALLLEIARKNKSLAKEAEVLNQRGKAALMSYNIPAAIGLFEQARTLFVEVENDEMVAGLTINIGAAYLQMQELDKALEYMFEGLTASRKAGSLGYEANALSNIGSIYQQQEDDERAEQYFREALIAFNQGVNPMNRLNAMQNLASVLTAKGEYQEASDLLFEAEKSAREGGYLPVLIGVLARLSELYSAQDDVEPAIERLLEVEKLSEEMGYPYGIYMAAINLSQYFKVAGKDEKAAAYFQKSLAYGKQLDQNEGLFVQLIAVGSDAVDSAQYQSGINQLEEALSLMEASFSPVPRIRAYSQLGKAYLQTGLPQKARPYLLKAYREASQTGLRKFQSESALNLYAYFKATRRPDSALYWYEEGISIREELSSEENQRAVLRREYEYAYEQTALKDSLLFEQQQATLEVVYEQQLARRNYLLFGGLGLALLGFIFFRYRQQIRNRERELELQKERERKEQLAELDGLKSRFFANISHEFRTPLTLILGQNQRLQAQIDDPALDGKFDMVDRNGRRLLELVNQVLDLSKLEAGKGNWNPQTLDLVSFLKNQLFSFESLADQKKQALQYEGPDEPMLMVFDPEKMERVIYNLISNAIKFTPENGKITLQLGRKEAQVEIRIVDNGQGISADQLPHIFDRFYQADSGQQHTAAGSGIGLTLVRELVELHDGKIEVESTVGEGTRFMVQLPVAGGVGATAETYFSRLEPLPEPIEKAIPAPSQPSPQKVLIVEDNPDVRNYLAEEVAGFGYSVILASDGQIGLQKARNEQPDLIISDVMMPRMDGFQLAEAIRSDVTSSHIPLILLTAKASDESRIEGLQTGVDAYLTKPFNSQELEIRIEKLIEQRQMLKQRFSEAMIIKPEEVSAVPMDQQFLQLVTDTIEAQLSNEQFGVEALADAAAMSSTHLNRKLRALIGQSAGKLIRSMRLQRGADLLKQQAGTISEIAYDLGFSDPTNFARAFKKQFGVSPSQYQDQGSEEE